MTELFKWVVLPLTATSVIYACLAAGYFFVQHRPGMCLAFIGYVIANVGLIWDAVQHG